MIQYLENYIDEQLRGEIKLQYKKDLTPPSYESILTETSDELPLYIKNKTLLQVLYDIFKEASKESVRIELEDIKKGIELN